MPPRCVAFARPRRGTKPSGALPAPRALPRHADPLAAEGLKAYGDLERPLVGPGTALQVQTSRAQQDRCSNTASPLSLGCDMIASQPASPASGAVRRLRVLLVASLIIPALLCGAAVWQERRVLLEEAGRQAERSAEVLEQHAAAAFHAYELIFARIDEHVRLVPGEDEATLHAYLASIDRDLKEVGSLFLVDAAGKVTAHSRFYPASAIDVKDRDYFRMLASGKGAGPPVLDERTAALDASGLAVGVPNAGRLSGASKLNIARALRTGDGRFAGAVAISVSQDYFEAFHRTLASSSGDSMALVRADGAVLARSPSLNADQTRLALSAKNQHVVTTRLLGRATTYASSLDGIERIAAFRELAAYPIYVGYGLGTSAVLRTWYLHLFLYAGIALLAASALFGVTWLALRAAQEEALARTNLVSEMGRREAAESALRQAQKMEAVGQLTGGIAHDFNNLLAVVLGNLELLAKRLPDDPRLRRYVDGGLKGARRGAALTQRMLAFSRRQDLKLETVDVPVLVRGMTDLLVRSLGAAIAIETHFPVQLATARADVNQLEAALLNLAVNARDAMPKGGIIFIAAHEKAAGPDGPPGLARGRYVVLAVTDTGEGMDAATLARAAEPFFTTKAVGKGTGLGLAMVHGLAAQSGGTLHLDSAPGRGTRVELWLPVADGPAPPPTAPLSALLDATHFCKVLLVDDDPLVREASAAMVEDLGHAVVKASSAREALAVLRSGTPVDLLMTDQVMPGMTGVELAAEVAALRPELPILLASGFAELSEADASLPRLAKPFTQAALAQAIADVTRARRTSGTVARMWRRKP